MGMMASMIMWIMMQMTTSMMTFIQMIHNVYDGMANDISDGINIMDQIVSFVWPLNTEI